MTDLISLTDATFVFQLLLIVFAAAFTAGLAGFGAALVGMPLLSMLVGPQMARAIYPLAFLASQTFMIISYRKQINLKSLSRMAIPSLLLIPVGGFAASVLPDRAIFATLAVMTLLYALYSLFKFPLPTVTNPNWGIPFGCFSGVLAGAFNTPGPPLIVYANMAQWERGTFKGNLQSVFFANSIAVNIMHFTTGNHSAETVSLALTAIPAIFLGIFLGKSCDRWINPQQFRTIVLILLIGISLSLLVFRVF